MVLVSYIGQYGSNAVVAELEKMGLSALTVSISQEKSSAFLGETELGWIRSRSDVQAATPVLMQTSSVSNPRWKTDAFILGVDKNAESIISIQVLYGRMFRRADIAGKAPVCLVDEAFAQEAYGRSNIIGKEISISLGSGSSLSCTVIGIVKTGGSLLQNMVGDYIPTFVYLPYTTMQEVSGRTTFDQIAVRTKESEKLEETGEEILQGLGNRTGTVNAYSVNNLAKQRDGLFSMLNLVVVILTAVGGISLLVASLSIMTIMLVSVNERTKEIGIKKAIGASRFTILLEFLVEAAVISGLGCLLGLTVGYACIWIAASILHVSVSIQWAFIGGIFLFSLCSGTIFGIYPAVKASALNPVDALRHE